MSFARRVSRTADFRDPWACLLGKAIGPDYLREMVRFGILPRVPDGPIDSYAADRLYWESHWYRPAAEANKP